MSVQYVSDYQEKIAQLIDNGGINNRALFQTANRYVKFPGNNLHYTFSLIPIRVRSGISKIETRDRHSDTLNEVDESGNFNSNNYVTSTRSYVAELQKKFKQARDNKTNLVILSEDSFLNKSLRA